MALFSYPREWALQIKGVADPSPTNAVFSGLSGKVTDTILRAGVQEVSFMLPRPNRWQLQTNSGFIFDFPGEIEPVRWSFVPRDYLPTWVQVEHTFELEGRVYFQEDTHTTTATARLASGDKYATWTGVGHIVEPYQLGLASDITQPNLPTIELLMTKVNVTHHGFSASDYPGDITYDLTTDPPTYQVSNATITSSSAGTSFYRQVTFTTTTTPPSP